MEQPVDQPFSDTATRYASDVVDGKIVSCRWHFLACRRHLQDLQRSDSDPSWPYVFNPLLTDSTGKEYRPAERICRFLELMPHIKGDWAARRQLIKLEAWQTFVLASIFGWSHRETGKRRFRVADLFIPRKNAKSTLAAGIGLYMLAVDDEFGAEVYSGATTQDQAMEVFRPALLMARATPRYLQAFGVTVNASNLSVGAKNAKFEPVIGNPGDGASPSCALIDEFHEHKTSALYETMQTGMGARSQPLIGVITTAGSNISGPCYLHQVELQKILEGVIENDQRFGIIFGVDESDDWTSETTLRKANPNYGVSIDPDFLKLQQRDAIADPRKQATFKTKHLNVWVAAASPWLNLYNLQSAGDSARTIRGEKWDGCIVGLDLASTQDIASAVWLCWKEKQGKRHYCAFSRNYVPESAVDKPENAHYRSWWITGHLIVTPGNMIDLSQIEKDVLESADSVHILEIAKDPWGGQQLGANLATQGFTVVDIPQQTRYLSQPMKEMQALVDDGRFQHDANPAYIWQLSNVECKADNNDNLFPRKQRFANKIDAAVATIIAMSRATAPREEEASFWEQEAA